MRLEGVMPDSTLETIRALSGIELPGDYMLCGGTALAMHWGHRISEDLDFVLKGDRLEDRKINDWLGQVSKLLPVQEVTPISAIHDSENDGFDLRESYRDYRIGDTKVTLFTKSECQSFLPDLVEDHVGTIPVLDTEVIFYLKVIALLDRHKSRDTFDLASYILRQEKNISDIVEAIRLIHPWAVIDLMLSKLTSVKYPESDEGFEQLVINGAENKIVDTASLSKYMRDQVSLYSQELVKENSDASVNPR